jgi:hypothetical protein
VPLSRPIPRAIGTPRLVPTPAELPPPWKSAWPRLFWLAWGLALAITDMRSEEVRPALLMLVAGAAVLGFARPRLWWFWSLALAAWVPAESLVNGILRLGLSPHVNAGAWFLPPIPALLGGFLGKMAAKAVRERDPARS